MIAIIISFTVTVLLVWPVRSGMVVLANSHKSLEIEVLRTEFIINYFSPDRLILLEVKTLEDQVLKKREQEKQVINMFIEIQLSL